MTQTIMPIKPSAVLKVNAKYMRTGTADEFSKALVSRVLHSCKVDYQGRQKFAKTLYDYSIDRIASGRGTGKLRKTTLLDKAKRGDPAIPLYRTGAFISSLKTEVSAKGKKREIRLFFGSGFGNRARLFQYGLKSRKTNSTSNIYRFWGKLRPKRKKKEGLIAYIKRCRNLTGKEGWVFARKRTYPTFSSQRTFGKYKSWALRERDILPTRPEIAKLLSNFLGKPASIRPVKLSPVRWSDTDIDLVKYDLAGFMRKHGLGSEALAAKIRGAVLRGEV